MNQKKDNILIDALDTELVTNLAQIVLLQERGAAIERLLTLLREPAAPAAGATKKITLPVRAARGKSAKNVTYVPQPTMAKALTEGPVSTEAEPNTMGMLRQVLRNAKGKTLSMDDLKAGIKQLYGVDPAKTMDQMLWRKSKEEKGFYKTEDGKFGLTELRVKIDTVQVGSTAVA